MNKTEERKGVVDDKEVRIKPKLFVMVGISASGKSSTAESYAKTYDCKVVSSDNIRSEICEGGVRDQSKNEEVFRIFHKRIRELLTEGYNVIADATNITMKSRRNLLENIRGVSCEKIAVIVPKSVKRCICDNSKREHPVPKYVIEKQMMSFQIPFCEEGFDDIVAMYEQPDATTRRFGIALVKTILLMDGFDQKNPHHTMTLGMHCAFTSYKLKEMEKYSDTGYILAALLHDIGKIFTQKFDDNGIAHYYRHENVGCYYLLSYFGDLRWYVAKKQYGWLDILFLVNYHMLPMGWTTEKVRNKWKKRFGDEKFQLLIDFNKCDKSRE